MNKVCTHILAIIIFPMILIAQNHGNESITGIVIIESSKKPLEFVNVVVINQAPLAV
jgi:hypothetical protein